MRTIRFLAGLLLVTSLVALPARAQSWYALTYQPAQPLGNTQDFTDNFGWRGIGFDFKKAIKPKLALGISVGWQVFDHQTDQVVSAFGVDISGDQFRYINSWPFLANINYFLGSKGKARPYVAANVGAYVIEQRLDIGLYSIHDTNIHFGLGPEAGVAIPMQGNLAAFINARYNYAFSAGSVDDQSYLTFGLGVAWTHGR
jgi:Outer membrane protein beta-barrel domain